MSLIETLVEAQREQPAAVSPLIVDAPDRFESDGVPAEEFIAGEYAIHGHLQLLVRERDVLMSALYKPRDGGSNHYRQIDLFRPVVLAAAEGDLPPINCFPFKEYASAFSIVGKLEEIQKGRVQPVRSHVGRTYAHTPGIPVTEERYGFAIGTDDPITLVNAGRSTMGLSPTGQTAVLSRWHPWDVAITTRKAFSEKHAANQALFKAFTEELLLHEGHAPVQVTIWR